MDIIDNSMYAYQNVLLATGNPIESDFVIPPLNVGVPASSAPPGHPAPVFNYPVNSKLNFCAFPDPVLIERAVTRHWYDVDDEIAYMGPGSETLSDFQFSSTYHLFYAYLLENTRIVQIFERVIERYFRDEELGIAENPQVFNWLVNTEKLFFKNDYPRASNLRSLIRPNADATRRNAYYRMFGIDLAFGDSNQPSGGSILYHKARNYNHQFIPLFEAFLAEVWQGYQNARNTSGPNTTDINVINDLAIELEELLAARRGGGKTYATRNLSREEFSAVLLTSWFTFIVSYPSPVVDFLACESSTIGERLMKIGEKVGLPAHKKCQALFEMAGPAGNVLCALEAVNQNVFADAAWVTTMLSSLTPGTPPSIHSNYMTDLLTIINNWEKATGHKIKNREANITGTVRLAQSRPVTATP